MRKTVQLSEDTYKYLESKMRGRETFDKTLRRLLRIRRGEPQSHERKELAAA